MASDDQPSPSRDLRSENERLRAEVEQLRAAKERLVGLRPRAAGSATGAAARILLGPRLGASLKTWLRGLRRAVRDKSVGDRVVDEPPTSVPRFSGE